MGENTYLPKETIELEKSLDENTMYIDIVESLAIADMEQEKNNVGRRKESEKEAMNEIINSLGELSNKIDEMNILFAKKIQHTTHEEKMVDLMHSELQKYKDDMYSQLVRPILMDIIEVRDSILRMSQNYASKSDGEQNIPLKVFSDYSFDIQDILEKNNITIYESAEGDTFVPIKQRIVKKIETAVAELHGKVAESLSSGYDYMGKPISPEKVAVYLYREPKKVKGENE